MKIKNYICLTITLMLLLFFLPILDIEYYYRILKGKTNIFIIYIAFYFLLRNTVLIKLKNKLNNKKLYINIEIFIILISIIFIYFSSLVTRSHELYKYLTNDCVRGWDGIAHEADSILGFKPIRNARAYHVFHTCDSIPMAYNNEGFRIPLNDSNKIEQKDSIDIIFFGCSFTYGDACLADSTFACLVGRELDLSYINAGVCSYGLSQMYILAKKLIPKYKPKYVVFQYSDWLLDRALSFYTDVYYGSLTVPYFIKKNNKFIIKPPIYRTQVFNFDKAKIRQTYKNKFIYFMLKMSLYFYFIEDLNKYYTNIRLFIGDLERPNYSTANKENLSDEIYNELINLSKEYNSQSIILNLGDYYNNKEFDIIKLKSFNDAWITDAVKEHNLYLKNNKTNCQYIFNHYRINNYGDTIFVDGHPNNLSHQIISNAIIKTIKNQSKPNHPIQ
jgi:hypothetical protein